MARRTVIVGIGKNARRIAQELHANPTEFRLLGFVVPYANDQPVQAEHQLGTLDDFGQLHEQLNINSVVVALDDNYSDTELYQIINRLYPYRMEIRFTPRIYEILTGAARIKQLNISPLVDITAVSMPDWQLCVKRAFDLTASLVALVLLMPLLGYCALRIKLDSEGSVFFKQTRIGKNGRPFSMIKFRTMRPDAEQGTPRLSAPDDPRITHFGRWLRKYRIDEIPQFWNVVRGDMSLVGPRPERQFYIDQIVERAPYYCLIYNIRPGLTSWGPIKIGYSDTVDKMVERLNYDIIYMEDMNLMVDMKILFYTIEVIVKGKGQ